MDNFKENEILNKNILIFGSQGFLGKNIVERLSLNDNNLTLFDRDFSSFDSTISDLPCINVVEGSLKSIPLIKKIIVEHQIEVVIHLVSTLIPSSTFSDFSNEMEEIINPTYELLNYLGEKKIKIIFFSSGGTIYGESRESIITEEHATDPISYYGYSKLLIENYIQYLHRTKNLPFLILRPSNVYGRYQRLDKLQGFIAVATGKILANDVIHIFGNGESVRDYIDVEDLAFITEQLIHCGIANQIFNIGTGIGVSLNDILLILHEATHCELNVKYEDERAVDVSRIILDVSKLNKAIEFKPKTLSKGIKDFIQYVKKINEE